MIVLVLRSDNPVAEAGLYNGLEQLTYQVWEAHRQLAETIHSKIKTILDSNSYDWPDIRAVVVFKGPGSFTGLRIGLTVANSLAENLEIPIVGTSGENWIEIGLAKVLAGENQKTILPEYGAEPHITLPKK